MPDSVENDTEQEAILAAESELEAQEGQSEEIESTDGDAVSPLAAEATREDQGGTDAAEVSQDESWQVALQEAGFQSFSDVDNAVRALVDANKQRDEQISMYADQLKFYQTQLSSRDLTQPNAAPQPEQKSEEKDSIQSLIENWRDPSWAHQYIEIDSEGNRVISENADDDIRQEIMDMDRKLRKWQEVIQDPRQLASAIDQRVSRMIQDKFESSYTEKQTEANEKATVDYFVNQNASWLYAQDPATGQYLVDPVTNNYIYSEAGNRFTNHMDDLRQKGVTSIVDQIEMAATMIGGTPSNQATPTQQASSAPTTQQTIEQQKRSMRGRSNTARTKQTSFNGVTPDSGSGVTGEQQLSFGELTLAAMKEGVE